MPNSGPRSQQRPRTRRQVACRGQLLLVLPVARDAHGRFTRWCPGMPYGLVAFRRDERGRFAALHGRGST